MTLVSLQTYWHDDLFHGLAAKLDKTLEGSSGSVVFFRAGTREGPTSDGQARDARCIYCRKTIRTIGARPRGKKQKSWRRDDAALDGLRESHTYQCAEAWAWKTLARWAIDECTPEEAAAITAWRKDLNKREREYVRRYPNVDPTHSGDWAVLRDVLAMFDRLPSRLPAIIQSIELLVASAGYYFPKFDPTVTPIAHGTHASNPHKYLPIKLGDAKYGMWGMCPCGGIEWRGPDLPLTEPLVLIRHDGSLSTYARKEHRP